MTKTVIPAGTQVLWSGQAENIPNGWRAVDVTKPLHSDGVTLPLEAFGENLHMIEFIGYPKKKGIEHNEVAKVLRELLPECQDDSTIYNLAKAIASLDPKNQTLSKRYVLENNTFRLQK